MSICSSGMYGDEGYGTSGPAMAMNRYTPFTDGANNFQRIVYHAHGSSAYPQDNDLPRLSYYDNEYENYGNEGYPGGGDGYYNDGTYYDELSPVPPTLPPRDAMNNGNGGVSGPIMLEASELNGSVIVTEDGTPYLLTTNMEMEDMAVNEPETQIEGSLVMSRDGKPLALVTRETVEAYYGGNTPPAVKKEFSRVDVTQKVTQKLEGYEGGDYGNDPSLTGDFMDLSDNAILPSGSSMFVTPLYARVDFGQGLDVIHPGLSFRSLKRRGKKYGRRAGRFGRRSRAGRRANVKAARYTRKQVAKGASKKVREARRLKKEADKLRQERRRLEKATERDAEAEKLLQKAEEENRLAQQAFDAAEAAANPSVAGVTAGESGGDGESYYYYPMSKYRSDYEDDFDDDDDDGLYGTLQLNRISQRVAPKSIMFKGQGKVTDKEPMESSFLGSRFHKSVWKVDDDEHEDLESQALQFFKEYYGIPVDKASRNKDGSFQMGNAFKIEPYGIKSGIKMIAHDIDGFSDDVENGAQVHEGGWKLTLLKNAILMGEFAEEAVDPKKVYKAGSQMKWGHWHISNDHDDDDDDIGRNNCHNYSIGAGLPDKNIIIHFESSEPIEVDDKDLDDKYAGPYEQHYHVDYIDPLDENMNVHIGNAIRKIRFDDTTKIGSKEQNGYIRMTTKMVFEQ